MKRKEAMWLDIPLVLIRAQDLGQLVSGLNNSALTGRRVGGEFSVAAAIRNLSSRRILYQVLVVMTEMLTVFL